MRIYKYILFVVILAAFGLAGCTQSTQRVMQSGKQPEDPKKVTSKSTDFTPETKKATGMEIVVYKSPTCGCCTSWEEHMEDNGFKVKSNASEKMSEIKQQNKVPQSLNACHTALVDGYVIEGHVPAADIKKLLSQRPEIVGLAVPGMPQHSPGMQPKGEKPEGFDVLSFDKRGKTEIFTSYK